MTPAWTRTPYPTSIPQTNRRWPTLRANFRMPTIRLEVRWDLRGDNATLRAITLRTREQLFLHRDYELPGANVDSSDEPRQDVAAEYERDRKLEAGAAVDSIFAKVIEHECVATQL